MKRNFFHSNKFRQGFLAHPITVLVVVLVLILNVIVSTFASRFGWYADMTKNDLFSLSDAFIDTLKDVDADVRIIFCKDPDELISDTQYMQYIYTTAKNLEAEFDNITVEHHDVIKEYDFFKQFKNTEASVIGTESIIIASGTEFRLMGPKAFFVFDTEDESRAWAYNGEKKFAAAILQVTATDNPLVLFTEKHGETLESDASAMKMLFADAGFTVKNIDLSKEDIPENCRIIVINNPRYDFIGMEGDSDETNEIKKLDHFLDGLGALMVFEDYTHAANLTTLNEFLEEWGIGFEYGTYLVDSQNSLKTGVIETKYEESGLGASIYMDMTENLDTMPRTFAKNAMPVNILWKSQALESGTKQVSSVLSSFDSAELIRGNETVSTGSRSVVALSRDKIIVNNDNSINADYIYSYVFACGSPDFVTSDFLNSKYGNADILHAAMNAVGHENSLADLKWKAFDDVELVITTKQGTSWTVMISAIPPAIIAITGIAVSIKRKNT